jgi:hypothetical protein
MSSAQVNRPTNIAVKEADVNRKLQLYGIFAGRYFRPFRALRMLMISFSSFPSWQGPIRKSPRRNPTI